MAENFIQASSVHSYGTKFRESGDFSIPKVRPSWRRNQVSCLSLIPSTTVNGLKTQ